MDILERAQTRARVHYIGYSSSHDEWKDISELEALADEEAGAAQDTTACIAIEPF